MTHRADTSMVGAGNRLTYEPTSHSTMPPFNHDVTNNLDQRKADCLELAKALVAKVSRDALERNPNLTPKLKEKLRDAERGRWEGLNKGMALLLEAMRGNANALALADAVKETTLATVAAEAVPCVLDSYITNTRAQKENDINQALFLVERTPARRDQLMDTLGPEEASLHIHKLAVLAWNPTNKRIFA